MANIGLIIVGIVVLIIIVAGVFFLTTHPSTNISTSTTTVQSSGPTTATPTTTTSSSSSQQTPVYMADPEYTPQGTQSFVITYSSVMVHTTGSNGGWVAAQGSGSVDLTSLSNSASAQAIAFANVTGSSVDQVKFDINSATITINGTTQNVWVPNSTVTAQVSGNQQANSGSAVFIDVEPTVAVFYNSTSSSYIMAPSSSTAQATVATNANASTSATLGSQVAVSSSTQAQFQSAAPSIVLTSANVTQNGNVTTVSVTVMDDSNSSVSLNNVLVYGPQSVSLVAGANTSVSIGGLVGGVTGNALAQITAQVQTINVMDFVATSGGSLTVPSSSSSFSGTGYVLAPGASTTLTYTGQITYSGVANADLEPGTMYNVVVTGGANAQAATSVTASGSAHG